MTLSRKVFDSLLPPGPAWEPKVGGGFDNLLNGIGKNSDYIENILSQLAYVRDPQKTPVLSDLEKEYGIIGDLSKTEQQRRDTLAAAKFKVFGNGDIDTLQNALNRAGFNDYNLQVHSNDPAVNPIFFLGGGLPMVAAGSFAYAGNQNAFAKIGVTEVDNLVVTGKLNSLSPVFALGAASQFAYAGNGNAIAGLFFSLQEESINYKLPINPITWPCVFFVGGDATRDGITGELLSIDEAMVPSGREEELRRIILKIKPLMSWAGLVINFT